jgi:D-3-phosphoglycerate dehydrogenase
VPLKVDQWENNMQNILMTLPKAWDEQIQPSVNMLKANRFSVELVWSDTGLSENKLIHFLENKHGYMMSLDIVTKKVLDHATNLRVLAKHGIGIDNIDIKAATEKKIFVCNTPGSNSFAVADLAMGMIIGITRKIREADKLIREGNLIQMMGIELHDNIMGIVVFGAIGKQVAIRAKAFGMKILAFDMIRDESFAREHGVRYAKIDEILETSDVVSLHVPLTPQTSGLINKDALKKMKANAFVVNLSRGGVVDEDAVADALQRNELQGAAFDVFAREPPDPHSKIFKAPNVLFCTHMAGCTKESIQRSAEMAAQNIIDILEGRMVKSVLNKEIY